MPHYLFYSPRYPAFSFGVGYIRRKREQAGEAYPSGVVKFVNKVLDTQVQGFTEDEADAIRETLATMKSEPRLGGSIQEVQRPEDYIPPEDLPIAYSQQPTSTNPDEIVAKATEKAAEVVIPAVTEQVQLLLNDFRADILSEVKTGKPKPKRKNPARKRDAKGHFIKGARHAEDGRQQEQPAS